jgi:hypothetical protein
MYATAPESGFPHLSQIFTQFSLTEIHSITTDHLDDTEREISSILDHQTSAI